MMKSLRTVLRCAAVAVAAGGLCLAVAQPASAADDLTTFSFAGKWVTKTLTQGAPLGNFMVLKKGCGKVEDCYRGSIRFQYQDGRRSDPININIVPSKDHLTVVWPGGDLTTGQNTSRATVRNGNIDLGKPCAKRLLFASGKDKLPGQCVFLAVQ